MKKLLFGLLATVMLSVTGNAQVGTYEQYLKIGKLHNEGLEYFYNSNLLKLISTVDSNVDLVINNVYNFSKTNEGLKTFADSSINICKLISKDYLKNDLKNIKSALTIMTNKALSNSTENLNFYLKNSLFPENFKSSEDYRLVLDKLALQVINDKNLTTNEKDIALFSFGIGKNSSMYWENYGQNWVNTTSMKLPPNFWKNFIKVDVASGVVGGYVGGSAGAVIVPGIGAVPGWVVGAVEGAIVGSIGWGVAELFWP